MRGIETNRKDFGDLDADRTMSDRVGCVISSKKSKLWDYPLRLIVSFVEALGRGSEEFYVYLPLADAPSDYSTFNGTRVEFEEEI